MPDEPNWMDGLKAGDEVFITNLSNEQLEKVERVTPTQVVVRGDRYRKSDGGEVGIVGRENRVRIVQAMPKKIAAYKESVKRRNLSYNIISKMDTSKLTTDQLQRILGILEEDKP